jgi:hypothetical protein
MVPSPVGRPGTPKFSKSAVTAEGERRHHLFSGDFQLAFYTLNYIPAK